MYFVFSSEIRSWRNQILHAKVQGEMPVYEGHWWDGKPLSNSLPHLTFTVNAKAPLLDNYFTGTEFDLYSGRLIENLREADVRFETFPASIIDRKTKQVAPAIRYEVFHLLDVQPGLDETHSDIDDEEIRNLVLTEACLQRKTPLFRLKENIGLVLIHQDLKSKLEAEGMTGCEYVPVDEYREGLRFYFEEKNT